ncbi:MAG: hypothetical protein IT442_14510 [Phycisphaeraceae bacterium]|nr:hypothetical protein [Phycisphaeraceae bacterium]
MSRRVLITGLGALTGLGRCIEDHWQALLQGRSAIAPIAGFDAAGLPCRIAAEVRDFAVRDFVPKSYRKATKVMARDIELAVAAADLAARDAGLATPGNADNGQPRSYPGPRMAVHVGAGLMAAEINELTEALAVATADGDPTRFDFHKWGAQGMTQLTPLWMLKYLPNMLACHVSIIHDAQGPSNTITCGESSGALSIGESLRVIQRGWADMSFAGAAESRLNPMALLRQVLAGAVNQHDNDRPAAALRPFCLTAAGTVFGEGGAVLTLETLDTFKARSTSGDASGGAYAEVIGFGASQTIHPESRNALPDPEGRGLAAAMRSALREAALTPADVDVIFPYASAISGFDQAEAAALRHVFGPELGRIKFVAPKSLAGNCGVASGVLDAALAAKALHEQTLPGVINCNQPLPGLETAAANRPTAPANLRHALCLSTGMGGQNAALVLRRYEP